MNAPGTKRVPDLVIGGEYRLIRHVGSGSFGDLYAAKHVVTGVDYAVKLEPINAQFPQLLYESKLYRTLQGGFGIPRTYWFGQADTYHALVLDLLGPNLEDLLMYCGRRFSPETTLSLGIQMLERVRFIHSRLFLHRDIKPENFLMGVGDQSGQVFCIDYGLAKRYRDPRTGIHIPLATGKSLTGTARYASLNTHDGVEPSRRDDLEALGYVLVYFLRGSLPWQGMRGATKKVKYEKIAEKKRATPLEALCCEAPPELLTYMRTVRNLGFAEDPDYDALAALLRTALQRIVGSAPMQLDWDRKRGASTLSVAQRERTGDVSASAESVGPSQLFAEIGSPVAARLATLTPSKSPTGPQPSAPSLRELAPLGTRGDSVL